MNKYHPPQSPRKKFINSYHVNQVPLPYYNPLEDPYLKGFFNSHFTYKLIQRRGLIYQPSKQYPYEQRRQTNYNKFLRSNSYKIPPKHIANNLEDLRRRPNLLKAENESEYHSTRSQLAKKMTDSEFLLRQPPRFDLGLKRPLSTTYGSQCSQQRERGNTFKSPSSTKRD